MFQTSKKGPDSPLPSSIFYVFCDCKFNCEKMCVSNVWLSVCVCMCVCVSVRVFVRVCVISIFNKFFSDTNVTTSIFASIYLLKSTIEMSQQCEKFVPSYLKKHNCGNDAFLVASLYLTLNRFHISLAFLLLTLN